MNLYEKIRDVWAGVDSGTVAVILHDFVCLITALFANFRCKFLLEFLCGSRKITQIL